MAATAAPDIRLNARAFANTLPVGAMLMACDYTAMAAAVGDAGEIPILPMHGRFDRLVPPATGREFGELVGREVWWIVGGHSWMIPRPASQLNVLRDTERGEAFMEEVRDRARRLKRPAA